MSMEGILIALFCSWKKGDSLMYNHAGLESAKTIERPIMLTPKEVASTGLMSLYSIRKGIANGTIPYIKIGSHYRINYTKLLRQLEEC